MFVYSGKFIQESLFRKVTCESLKPGLTPSFVVQAYADVGQEYERTPHDRAYQDWFYPMVTPNEKLKEQEIEDKIDQMVRTRDSKGEWFTYHVSLTGHNYKEHIVDFSYVEGCILGWPIFHKEYDPQTDEVIPNSTTRIYMKIQSCLSVINELKMNPKTRMLTYGFSCLFAITMSHNSF